VGRDLDRDGIDNDWGDCGFNTDDDDNGWGGDCEEISFKRIGGDNFEGVGDKGVERNDEASGDVDPRAWIEPAGGGNVDLDGDRDNSAENGDEEGEANGSCEIKEKMEDGGPRGGDEGGAEEEIAEGEGETGDEINGNGEAGGVKDKFCGEGAEDDVREVEQFVEVLVEIGSENVVNG